MSRFIFVSGDIGGAKMQLPVIKKLIQQDDNHSVTVVSDPEGKGYTVFQEVGILPWLDIDSDKKIDSVIANSDLAFVSTCASATKTELAFAQKAYGKVPVVLGVDGFFNHRLKAWQNVKADYWFAINEGHAQAIRSARSQFAGNRVVVVGQPAFDVCIDLIPRKEEIRTKVRQEFNIAATDVIALWWSQGTAQVIEEDIEMAQAAIRCLPKGSIFIARLHPKLENIRKGYLDEIRKKIQEVCDDCGVKVLNADRIPFPGEELCLAVDVIFSITCTEDIKSVMMGGPPVIHFLGPKVRAWFEQDLFLKPPYLPDLMTGQAMSVYSRNEIAVAIHSAFSDDHRARLLSNWVPPIEKSTDKVANELISLANGPQ